MENELLTTIEELLNKKLDEKLGELNGRMDRLDVRMRCLEQTVESEICPNIMRVAKRHSDLDDKLDEALKFTAEIVMLNVKVNHLDATIRTLIEAQNVKV